MIRAIFYGYDSTKYVFFIPLNSRVNLRLAQVNIVSLNLLVF